jgi:hypothetical protein
MPTASGESTSDYSPDFVLSHQNVIHEGNWQEYVAKGFVPVPEPYELAKNFYGIPNVYTGDRYDYREGRPLRHKLGGGVYTNQAGLEYLRSQFRDEDWFRDIYRAARGHDAPSPGPS